MGGKIIDNYKKILKQEYLESLSIHKKLKILRSLKTKSKKTLFDNETKFLYDKYVALYKQSIEYKDKFAKLLVPELNDKEKEISVLVSDYAAVNQPEFLAEVFKKICRDGLSSVPGNVMNLYQSIGGVILPNFPK